MNNDHEHTTEMDTRPFRIQKQEAMETRDRPSECEAQLATAIAERDALAKKLVNAQEDYAPSFDGYDFEEGDRVALVLVKEDK